MSSPMCVCVYSVSIVTVWVFRITNQEEQEIKWIFWKLGLDFHISNAQLEIISVYTGEKSSYHIILVPLK